MATRFAECSDKLIQNSKEKSTVQKKNAASTKNWLKVWQNWAKQAGYSEYLRSYQPEELNLCIASVRSFMEQRVKQDETEYKSDSLCVMQSCKHRVQKSFQW